jgi:hypothetical protein
MPARKQITIEHLYLQLRMNTRQLILKDESMQTRRQPTTWNGDQRFAGSNSTSPLKKSIRANRVCFSATQVQFKQHLSVPLELNMERNMQPCKQNSKTMSRRRKLTFGNIFLR